MFKGLAIVALLLAVNNAGKEKNGSRQPSGDGGEKPAPAVSFVHNETTYPNAQAPKTEPPHWYTIPEWWLCILGVPTLYYLIRQTKATRIAADAALLNARAVMDSERAWMIAGITKIPTSSQEANPLMLVPIQRINKGKTPAFIMEMGSRIEVVGPDEILPSVPSGYRVNNIAKWDGIGAPLAPNGEIGQNLVDAVPELSQVLAKQKVLWVHGYIRYHDIFLIEVRETYFCFQWNLQTRGEEGTQWAVDGPEAYNRAT